MLQTRLKLAVQNRAELGFGGILTLSHIMVNSLVSVGTWRRAKARLETRSSPGTNRAHDVKKSSHISGITTPLTSIFKSGFRTLPCYFPQLLSIKTSLSTEPQSSRSMWDRFRSLKETNAVGRLTV